MNLSKNRILPGKNMEADIFIGECIWELRCRYWLMVTGQIQHVFFRTFLYQKEFRRKRLRKYGRSAYIILSSIWKMKFKIIRTMEISWTVFDRRYLTPAEKQLKRIRTYIAWQCQLVPEKRSVVFASHSIMRGKNRKIVLFI